MAFLNISKKSVKVDALNGICKFITYKLRKADVMRESFSILLNIVIFFLIFVCLVIKTNCFLRIYLQLPLRTSGAVIFIPYILLPSTYEVMLLICSRVTRLPACWQTGNDRTSDTQSLLLDPPLRIGKHKLS